MSGIFKTHYDRFALGLAMIVLAVGVASFWRGRAEIRRIRAVPVAVRANASEYKPVIVAASAKEQSPWTKPAAQSTGAGWLYELFTPPVVFYNQQSASFTVMPPLESITVNSPFDLELLSVKRDPYRLQLAGYFGERGAYTAILTALDQPGILRVRSGERLEKLGVTLKSFSVGQSRSETRDKESHSIDEIAAFAELIDDITGTLVLLDSRAPKFNDAAIAVIRLSHAGASREVRADDLFSDNRYTYRIESVQFAPAEVVVSRHENGASVTETTTVRPAISDGTQSTTLAENSKNHFLRPATGLVTTDQ